MADKKVELVEVHCPHLSWKDVRECFPPDMPTFRKRFKEICIGFFPHAVLVFCQIALAGMKVYSQMTLSELKDGFVFSAMWAVVAIPCLFSVAYIRDGKIPPLKDMPWIFLLGVLGISGHHILLAWALTLASALDAAIMQPFVPVLASFIAILMRMEPFRWLTAMGALICTGAAFVMVDFTNMPELGPHVAYGMLLLFGSCLCDALYTIISKPLLERISPFTLTAWAFVFGGSINILVGSFFIGTVDWEHVSLAAWGGVLYAGLVSTSMVFVLQAWALARMKQVSMVAAFTAVQPVAAMALSSLFLGTGVTLVQGVGAFCIVLGVIIVSIVRSHDEMKAAVPPSGTKRKGPKRPRQGTPPMSRDAAAPGPSPADSVSILPNVPETPTTAPRTPNAAAGDDDRARLLVSAEEGEAHAKTSGYQTRG